MVTKQGLTPRRWWAAFPASFWVGVLTGTYLLLAGLPEARADWIAEAKYGEHRGYLYIGKGMTKWQGLTSWSTDLVVRDDKKSIYFISQAPPPREGPQGESAANVEARVGELRRQLEAGDSVVPASAGHPEPVEAPLYETRIVSYDEIRAYRQMFFDRATTLRKELVSRGENLAEAAVIDIFVSGKPTWTNTGETAVIAGRQSTKYRVLMAPVFSADVWMTEELGPGYGAGETFDKVFDMYRGGLRPLELLGGIPGFPLKIKADQRDVFGLGISQFEYEVLKLMETDLDENEFGPRAGSRVYEGKHPGID